MQARRQVLVAYLAGAATVAVVGGGVAVAAIPSSANGSITACANKKTGAVRVVDAQLKQRCTTAERSLLLAPGVTHRGGWVATTAYRAGDIVIADGATYLAKAPSAGKAPAANPAAWGVLSPRSAPGASGPAGPPGPAGAGGEAGPAGAAGTAGNTGPTGATGASGASSPILVRTAPATYLGLGSAGSPTAIVNASASASGSYLARVDAQLDTTGAQSVFYACMLQSLNYPALLNTPHTEVPATRRTASWRLGHDSSGAGTGATVSISMQAVVTAGAGGTDIQLVCWSEADGSGFPLQAVGAGLTSAVLTVQPVGTVG